MIIQADILQWAESYDGPPFHAAFCDAPYHLTELNKRFAAPDATEAQYGTDGAFQRASRGFMGKDWDGGDIAFQPVTWAAIARHVYPGGFIVSFAGSRGWHRMAVAMEDAGLLMHPTIFLWAYGSGFPKATRIDAQIAADAFRAWLIAHPVEQNTLRGLVEAYREARRAQRAGTASKADRDRALADLRAVERDLKLESGVYTYAGQRKHAPKFAAAELGYREKDNGFNSRERTHFDVLEPVMEEAQRWAGHRYGGQALKPAVEPIIIAQKPYEGRAVDCITQTGAGALWVDGGRIGTGEDKGWDLSDKYLGDETTMGIYGAGFARASTDRSIGRWPANFVFSHSPECNGTCAPHCPVQRLGEQSGETEATRSVRVDRNTKPGYDGGWQPLAIERGHADSGTAARYFFQADYLLERMAETDPVGYFAKASSAEREAGLDDMCIRLMRELYGEDIEEIEGTDAFGIGALQDSGRGSFDLTTVDDGRATPIDNPYQRGETIRRNTHPTIKPLSLNRWLATLLLPPEPYAPRRLLVPFAGAGSEVIGAMLAGWEEVVGVELEADHVKIAQARIAYWSQLKHKFLNPDTPIKIKAAPKVPDGQLELF